MENNYTLEINTNELKALSLAAETKTNGRYYLQGVHIYNNVKVSFDESPTARMAATNGHILAIGCCMIHPGLYVTGNIDMPNIDIIMPLDIIKRVTIGNKQPKMHLVCEDNKYTLDDLSFTPIEGSYPNIARVIPSIFSGEAGHYDSKYLTLIDKMRKVLKSGNPTFYQNGPADPAGFRLSEHCAGVLMPMKAAKLETVQDTISELLTTGNQDNQDNQDNQQAA